MRSETCASPSRLEPVVALTTGLSRAERAPPRPARREYDRRPVVGSGGEGEGRPRGGEGTGRTVGEGGVAIQRPGRARSSPERAAGAGRTDQEPDSQPAGGVAECQTLH